MDIIQELENLKSYVAGLARTDVIFTSMPPQHGFSSYATVESVISEIDLIENKVKKESEKNKSINCKVLIKYINSYVSAGGPCTEKFIKGLYHYIDIINTEIVTLKSQTISPKLNRFLNRLRANIK